MTVLDRASSASPGRTGGPEGPRGARRGGPEVGGAALLLAGTAAALVWANSPWAETYDAFWHTQIRFGVGTVDFALDLQHWVNDGLMAFFFFVVGLEVKRELVLGELADRRRVAVPALAALVGLVAPALIYAALNHDSGAAGAWGVVISTDTAFVVGILALLGSSCPPRLRVFLMALAIADDVGALGVIAIFHTDDLALGPLALAVAGVGLMFALRWLRVWRGPAYLVIALGAWVALYLSGVHPTLLGVTLALITPAYRPRRAEVDEAARRARTYLQSPSPEFAAAAQLSIARSVPVGERLQQLWRPWTNYVFVPLFALANAGVTLSGDTLRAATTSPVTLGVVAGLVLGKLVGILTGTGLAVRLHLGDLPPGLSRLHLAGGAALSGIGFTISLFIVDLAFDDELQADQARVGILAASLLAGALGVGLLLLASRHRPDQGGPLVLDPPIDLARDHVRGPGDAPLTLVEYGNFESFSSGRATGSVRELQERFGDQLRYVFRHALVDEHVHAQLAAEASEAAAAQGRFWQMHDRLFAAQERLSTTDLLEHAAAEGLDVQRFVRDLGTGQHARRVRDDLDSAVASGVTEAPTFFVDGHRHTGPHDAETLAAVLRARGGALTPGGAGALPARSPAGVRPAPGDVVGDVPDLPEDLVETPARSGDHPRLDDEQIARLERHGARRQVARGDTLYRPGDAGYAFHVVLSGAVAVVGHPRGRDRPVVRVHGPRRFLGELDLLDERPVVRTAVVVRPGEVVRLSVQQLRTALAEDAHLREVVLRAFLVRRSIGLELSADLRVLGRAGSPDLDRITDRATALGLTTDVVDLDAGGSQLLDQLGASSDDLPLVVTRSGRVVHHPDDADLDRVLRETRSDPAGHDPLPDPLPRKDRP